MKNLFQDQLPAIILGIILWCGGGHLLMNKISQRGNRACSA
jgi:hypothetical protein